MPWLCFRTIYVDEIKYNITRTISNYKLKTEKEGVGKTLIILITRATKGIKNILYGV